MFSCIISYYINCIVYLVVVLNGSTVLSDPLLTACSKRDTFSPSPYPNIYICVVSIWNKNNQLIECFNQFGSITRE